MGFIDKTMKFDFSEEPFDQNTKDILLRVHEALEEKGYNPINQIVGYLLSGDPAYIPRHNNARNLIRKIERDEVIEELVTFYIKEKRGNKE
ncbi:MAG TPA: IreB family regulatory phosphoprotein [Candidatus Avamphibacillus intestinigallinarum]|nr:IreB family regulatory phosphoprotein [Candidatus Avamphibacillus intestinigallinarum]